MRKLLPFLLSSLLLNPALAKPADPGIEKTKARLSTFNKIPDGSNSYSQVGKLLLVKESPTRTEAKALAPLFSVWPESKTTLEKIKESKTFESDRATFEKLMKRIGPAFQLPYFYARQDFKQENVPNWLGLREYCMSQNVLGVYLGSQGKGEGLKLLGNSLVTAQHISGNGVLIQQMISLNLNNGACESLFQLLQTPAKLPLPDLLALQQRLKKAAPEKSDMANSLDIEEVWNVTRMGAVDPKAASKHAAFHAKWRPQVAGLAPSDAWRAKYIKERDALAETELLLMGMTEIDYTGLADFWREGIERRSLLDLMLSLEIRRQQKGSYPRSLNEIAWKGAALKYTSDGKSYSFESTSPAWDSKGKGSQRKPTPRRFQSPRPVGSDPGRP